MGYRYETSLPAYNSIKDDLSFKQKQVWDALYTQGEMTDQELSSFLKWPINTITPRRGELFEKGWVVMAGTKIGATKRSCVKWRAIVKRFENENDYKSEKYAEGEQLCFV